MLKYLAILTVVVGLAYGESSIAESPQHINEGGSGAQTSQTDKRGTEASPLVINEHTIQSDSEAAEEARKDAEQNRVNGRIIALTFTIAICAGLQFFGILGQIFVYLKQTKIMQDTLTAISGQATDARKSAADAAITTQETLAAIKQQAESLDKQTGHMAGQLEEMQKAREIENRTLILQYRPRIIVRNVKALQFSPELQVPSTCEIRFTVVNIGGSPAHFVEGGATLQLLSFIGTDINNIEAHDGDEYVLPDFTLEPGQQRGFQEVMTTGTDNDFEWSKYRNGGNVSPPRFIHLMGRLRYLDDLNIPRATGISRKFDPRTMDFVPRPETEDEYTD